MNFLSGFLFTFLVELLVYFILIKKKKDIFLYCFLINLFTWPLANFFYGVFGMFYLIEFFVFTVEGILVYFLFNLDFRKSFLISFVANFISALGSFVL